MADLNTVAISGRLTDDPELRQLPDGTCVCSFAIACNRRKSADGTVKADFINVVTYRATAEIVSRNFCKGKPIIVHGELRTKTYQDKRYPDVKHYSTEIQASSVYFAGKTKAEEEQNGSSSDVKFAPPEFLSEDFEEITE